MPFFLLPAVFLVGLPYNCSAPPSTSPPPVTVVYDFITGPEYEGHGVCSDGSGNSYVTGTSSVSFDDQTNHGGTDAVLIKYDSLGNRVWTRLIGGTGAENGAAITYDSNGAVYVAGTTDSTFDSQTNNGGNDAFITKYNVNGVFEWTTFIGGTLDDYGLGIAVDGNGNVYVAGYTYSSFNLQSNAGSADGFISKFDSSGNPGWTKFVGSTGSEFFFAVACVGTSTVYCGGGSMDSVDGQPFQGQTDILIAKLDTSGNNLWTRLAGSTQNDYANGIAANAAGVYAAGTTFATFNGQTYSGGGDAVMIKYDPDGNPVWTRFSGASGSENGYGAALDSSGNCYLAGSTTSSFDGQTNAGGSDAFVTSWDADGNPGTTTFYGGAQNDYAYGIGFDWSTVYVTGVVNSVS